MEKLWPFQPWDERFKTLMEILDEDFRKSEENDPLQNQDPDRGVCWWMEVPTRNNEKYNCFMYHFSPHAQSDGCIGPWHEYMQGWRERSQRWQGRGVMHSN